MVTAPEAPASLLPPPPAGGWRTVFARVAVPRLGARGHVPSPLPEARRRAAARYQTALRLVQDPDLAPWLRQYTDEYAEPLELDPFADDEDGHGGDPFAWTPADFADLLGMDDPDDALSTLDAVGQCEANGGCLPARFLLETLADQALCEAGERLRPRLVHVSEARAFSFVREHHSKLPQANPRGLLFCFGVSLGARLAAVATVNTPSGAFRGRPDCPPDAIVELARIASDATVRGASSMLAARAIDVLPALGRRGHTGKLLVTYSLLSEAGTTYLALADKGLRPTGVRRGQKPSGTRSKADAQASRMGEAKVVWQAGPAAAPADWSALEGVADPKQLAAARKAFAGFEAREAAEKARLARRAAANA